MIILYVFFGFVGGFVSSYTYKNLGGENWKLNIALTPILVPGLGGGGAPAAPPRRRGDAEQKVGERV